MSKPITEVDQRNKKLGLRDKREFESGKFIHRGSCLFLLNEKGKVLLQKRSQRKKLYPGKLDFSVSGTLEDESYLECIRRESEEELGLENLEFFEVGVFRVFIDNVDKSFQKLFISYLSAKSKLALDEDEIEEVCWFGFNELEEMIRKRPDDFSPHLLKGLNFMHKNELPNFTKKD